MRGAVQLAAILVAALGAGCTTIVDTTFDETHDFSRYHTWDWLPRGRSVRAIPATERRLYAAASRLVEGALQDRGLERVAGEADLLVGYALRVQRQLIEVHETGAHSYLASHHASPSYLVQTTTSRVDSYDVAYLQIVMVNGQREQLVWRGELWARRQSDFSASLPDAVARLFEELPAGESPLGQPASGIVGAREDPEAADRELGGCHPDRGAPAADPGVGPGDC